MHEKAPRNQALPRGFIIQRAQQDSREKLAALVPPPRLHLIRYHGVLAPHAADRALIVPAANATDGAPPATANTVPLSPVQRLKWAQLLARTLAIDVTVCPRCGGTMHLVAALTDPHSIRT